MEMMEKGGVDAGNLFQACLDFTCLQNDGKVLPMGARCGFHVHKVTKKCCGKK